MFGVPDNTPVTMPVDEPTVASAGLLLLHVPPLVKSLNGVVAPTQTTLAPPIAAGVWLTVNGVVAVQPVPIVYVIVSVPADTPDTTPELGPIVAMVISLLVQEPPAGV